MANKFAISRSPTHCIIHQMLDEVFALGQRFIQWWNDAEKLNSSSKFKGLTGIYRIIGTVDGCHVRINCPPWKGDDYLNRKFLCSASVFVWYSILYGIDAEPQISDFKSTGHIVSFAGCQKYNLAHHQLDVVDLLVTHFSIAAIFNFNVV